MQYLKNLILIVYFLFSASCSGLNLFSSPAPPQDDGKKAHLPFSLEISDEVNDGDRLHILGTVSASADWSLKDVIVKLSGFSSGKVTGISYLPLAKTQKKMQAFIKANDKYSFTISVPSKNISDYQLELLWGVDAKRYLEAVAIDSSGPELHDVQFETIRQPCEGSDCNITFRVSAKLYNAGNKGINGVILGIGYIRVPEGSALDLGSQIPQNEDKIDIGKISLSPGAGRDLVLNFDKEIPESELKNENGELKPNIRILNFSTE